MGCMGSLPNGDDDGLASAGRAGYPRFCPVDLRSPKLLFLELMLERFCALKSMLLNSNFLNNKSYNKNSIEIIFKIELLFII